MPIARVSIYWIAGLVVPATIVGSMMGCQAIAGVDFDSAKLAEDIADASVSPSSLDGAAIDPTTNPLGDGDAGAATSSCTPDPNTVTCAGNCGPTQDNCGSTRQCSPDCGLGKACASGKCACVAEGTWCNNRCGQTQDNCGRPVNCGGCPGSQPCTNNACGCTPDPVATTCAGKACGTAVNNCGQTVACGAGGACATVGAICKADGSCCADDGTACTNRCGSVTVKNNCNQDVGCPAQCPAGQACTGTTCCVPEPVATTCAGVACGPKTNNCGQTITCPSTCAAPNTCGGGGAGANGCGCTPTGNPCGNRCSGTMTNNCGQAITCNAECFEGVCGCHTGFCNSNHTCTCNSGPCP